MKADDMARRFENLGRAVIPKEIRRTHPPSHMTLIPIDRFCWANMGIFNLFKKQVRNHATEAAVVKGNAMKKKGAATLTWSCTLFKLIQEEMKFEADIGIGVVRVYGNEQFASNMCLLDVPDFQERQTLCLYYKNSAVYGNV